MSFQHGSSGVSEVCFIGMLPVSSVMMHFIIHFPSFIQVYVHSLVTEHSLVNRSSEFEAAIQNGEKSLLRALCEKKSEESEYVIYDKKQFFYKLRES